MKDTQLEILRADVAKLVNSMFELRLSLNALEIRYSDKANMLTEKLTHQAFCRINTLFLQAYCEALVLDAAFFN